MDRPAGERGMQMDILEMRIEQTPAPQQTTIISHRQIQAVRVLQMPSQELVAAIHRERDANPAFEVEERECCHHCGSGLEPTAHLCPVCGVSAFGAERTHDQAGDYSSPSGGGSQFEDDGSDP